MVYIMCIMWIVSNKVFVPFDFCESKYENALNNNYDYVMELNKGRFID